MYAKACLEAFRDKPTKFFAAYIAFVQSSGLSKTRTLMEIASRELSIYVCARHPDARGFPLRDKAACTFLGLEVNHWNTSHTAEATAMFDLSLRLLIIYKLALDPKWDMRSEAGKKKQFNGQFASFWDAATKEYSKLATSRKDNTAMLNAYDLLVKELVTRPFVMFAIDEASTLLDLEFPGEKTVFRAIRAAIRELQRGDINMVLVLTDTYSNVSTFLPSVRFDSSQRPDDGNPDERTIRGLFPPFILRTTFDVLRSSVGLGRPLVAEHANKTRFLQSKLAGSEDLNQPSGDGMLALMLVRVAAYISPQSRVSERLVASHMGTLLASSADRESLLVTYLSEPPLAAAASQLWDTELCKYLSALHEALTNGAESAGSAGEIVAQIVCLVAFDSQCSKNNRLSGYIRLKDFLHMLQPLGAKNTNLEFIPEEHYDATLSVLQFVQLPKDFEFTEEALQELYVRQTAGVLPPGQAGADLLIPYKYGAEEYSFVLVQVKNWTKASDFTKILTKLHPKFVFGKDHAMAKKQCTRICMHLGDHRNIARKIHGDPHETEFGCKAFELYSVRFRCLEKYDGFEDHLIRLLTTVNNTVEFVEHAKSQCESEGIPVPEGDSREGLMGFPFVCGSTTMAMAAAAQTPCCACRDIGPCTNCICGKAEKPCTSCASSKCQYMPKDSDQGSNASASS